MIENVPREFRKFTKHFSYLRKILRDTETAINDIKNSNALGEEIKEKFNLYSIESVSSVIDKKPSIVVFGQNCNSKAMFINFLLNTQLLPFTTKDKWRWIKLMHGGRKTIKLMLESEYEIVEKLKSFENSLTTISNEDLSRKVDESPADHCPTVEVEYPSEILRENVNFIIPPDCESDYFESVLKAPLEKMFPIFIYTLNCRLTDSDINTIRILKEIYPEVPIIFLKMKTNNERINETIPEDFMDLRDQLARLGFIPDHPRSPDLSSIRMALCSECMIDNNVMYQSNIKEKLHLFIRDVLKAYLLRMSAILSEHHNACLRVFILSAFDMAREIQITPRRINYAQDVEMKLFRSLMELAVEKHDEMNRLIQMTLEQMKENVEIILEDYQIKENETKSAKAATMEIHTLVFRKLTHYVAARLVQSTGYLRESYTGTLQRCLESLERNCHELDGSLLASDAVKQIVNAAYTIDLKSAASLSVVESFMDRLKRLILSIPFKWSTCTQDQFDKQWQTQVAIELIDSLSSSKLAKTVACQFQEQLRNSHDAFHSAMRFIENQLSGQLEETEEQRIAIRKRHAPNFARLALESTSLCDLVRWGKPEQIQEIGRGQYGVVFSASPWGGIDPCAVKSVVPPDDRHWNDLAMEFYYTRTIPEHPRIVKLRGSVIDHSYGNGCLSAVLLVMERMRRDLFCALKTGLSWHRRIRIAIDVVEGIRYLHSQGLVHRDIKLKNVLLDAEDRAKLTDFGFCIPEPMMSGSVVGTPVHMAPELLSGRYDSSVDVYAFGVLLWYLCAGKVELPASFEQFMNKEQLWTSVKKGIRPECLVTFDKECWNLMEQCWAADPSERPLLGDVQPQLEAIYAKEVHC